MLPAEPCVVAPIFILGGITMAPLQEQIQAINQRLRAYGIEAVQEIRMTDSDGKTIGQVKYG